MSLSKANLTVIFADKKGYKIINGKVYSHLNRELKPFINQKGYPVITIPLGEKGNKYPIKVHKLVAYQKFGDVLFKKGIEVRHLNGNKLDFSFENIEIGTAKQNSLDKPFEQRLKWSKNAHKFRKRAISFELASKIREELNQLKDYQFGDYAKIARKYEVLPETVVGIKRGRYSTPY